VPVPVVYSARYDIDIGVHVFPTRKYRLVHDRLLESGVIRPVDVVEPELASWDDLALVHTSEYLEKLDQGTLSREEIAELELPWSPAMVEGFRVMVGGTVLASRIATDVMDDIGTEQARSTPSNKTPPEHTPSSTLKVACHIGGGLHHAFANHGEGFCPFNDVAVAVRMLQRGGLQRVAIVDLDVHHGNGTAFIFESDPRVFTFSMHQQHNYPLWKPRGSLDIGLPDGTHDATYLRELDRGMAHVLASGPECVFYLAGADPYEDDQLGGLRLSMDGLRERDRNVIEAVASAGVPLVIVMAGGYARQVADTVAIHAATIEEAVKARTPSARAGSLKPEA
jgi:acetoin utilization deacetylase AcuC-like enzyme